jgi:hypothetical protein
MAEDEQLTNEEGERQYREIEDWFARKGKLFWTEEAWGGTWDAYVASGPAEVVEQSAESVGPCVRGAETRLEAAQKARELHRKLP